MTFADFAENNTGRGLIYVLEDIRDQLALSNRIALAVFLKDQYGSYAPPLYEGPETKDGFDLLQHSPNINGNVRLADNIRGLLGLPVERSEE